MDANALDELENWENSCIHDTLFSKIQTVSAITSFVLISSAGYEQHKSNKIAESGQEKCYCAYVKKKKKSPQTKAKQTKTILVGQSKQLI